MARLSSELVLSLRDEVSGPARRVSQALADNQRAIERNQASIRRTQGQLLGAVAVGGALAVAIRRPVEAAMRFESALADVRKVVSMNDEEAAGFRQRLLDLSKEIPLSVQELAELAAAGGEAGLRGEALEQYVEMAAKLQTALGMSTEASGTFINSARNALGLTLDDTLLLSDALNHLSNNMASNAPDLAAFMIEIAGDSRAFGHAAEEALAFGSAMIAAGAAPNVAATSYRNMGRALTRGASATGRQKAALDALGLSAEEVARRMQDDATGTILDVLDRLAEVPAEARAALSSDLFGNEARALSALLTNTDLLRESLGYVGDEANYAGSAYQEFASRSETFESDLVRFQNVMAELAITIGEALLPTLTEMMETIAPFIESLSAWMTDNQKLVGTLFQVTSALVGLRIAFFALKLAGLYGRGSLLAMLGRSLAQVGSAAGSLSGRRIAAPNFAPARRGFQTFQQDATDSMRAVENRALAMQQMLNSLRFRGLLASLQMVFAALTPPEDPEERRDWQDRNVEAIENLPGVSAIPGAAAAPPAWTGYLNRQQRLGVRDLIAAQEDPSLVSAEHIERLRTGAERLREQIAGARRELDGMAEGAARDNLVAGIEGQEAQLGQMERALADAEARAEALRAAMTAIDETNVSPTIDAASIEGAIEKARALSAELREAGKVAESLPSPGEVLRGLSDLTSGSSRAADQEAAQPGWMEERGLGTPHVAGERARGGPVSRGLSYLVGERGPELFTPGASGMIHTAARTRAMVRPRSLNHPAAAASGGAGTGGRTVVNHINLGGITVNAPNTDVDAISRELGDRVAFRMRGHFSDEF